MAQLTQLLPTLCPPPLMSATGYQACLGIPAGHSLILEKTDTMRTSRYESLSLLFSFLCAGEITIWFPILQSDPETQLGLRSARLNFYPLYAIKTERQTSSYCLSANSSISLMFSVKAPPFSIFFAPNTIFRCVPQSVSTVSGIYKDLFATAVRLGKHISRCYRWRKAEMWVSQHFSWGHSPCASEPQRSTHWVSADHDVSTHGKDIQAYQGKAISGTKVEPFPDNEKIRG